MNRRRRKSRGCCKASSVIASEAKQSILSFLGHMDCFASLAMTTRYASALSQRIAPEVLQENLALENRGRREDRVRAAPAVSRAKLCIKHAHEHTGSAENTRAFPAQWLYGLYVIALVTGFLATIISRGFRLRQLDASTGASGIWNPPYPVAPKRNRRTRASGIACSRLILQPSKTTTALVRGADEGRVGTLRCA